MGKPAVWPFQANGGETIAEDFGFMTEVLEPYRRGQEQRIAQKEHPLGALEAEFYLFDEWESQRAQVLLFRKHAQLWAVPLWPYAQPSAADAAAGAVEIQVPTAYIPFTDGLDFGPYALAWQSAKSFELLTLNAIRPSKLELVTPLAKSWAAGTYILPVRTARLDPSFDTEWVTSGKLRGPLRFIFEAFTTGEGVPTLDDPPPAPSGDFVVFEGQTMPVTAP